MALYSNSTQQLYVANSEDYEIIRFQTYTGVGKSVAKGIPITMFIVGIAANAFLILYLLRSGRFKSPLFMLITVLALTDFGTCFGAISYIVFLFPTMEIPNTDVMCPLTVYVTATCYMCSVCHLVLFACLRYAQLVHPLWSRAHITWQAVLKACALTWFCCSLGQLHFTVLQRAMNVAVGNTTDRLCAFTGTWQLQYIAAGIFGFFLPSVLIVAIHIAKEIRLKCRVKKSLTETDVRRLSSDPRALTIVVVLYYVTWIPNITHLFSHTYGNASYLFIHNFLFFGLRLLSYFNSVLDPFVYCFASKTVRGDIHGYFCGGCRTSVNRQSR